MKCERSESNEMTVNKIKQKKYKQILYNAIKYIKFNSKLYGVLTINELLHELRQYFNSELQRVKQRFQFPIRNF